MSQPETDQLEVPIRTREPHPEQGARTGLYISQGMCYILFAHEIGLSIDLNEAERHITATKHRETIRHKRRAPQYFEFDPTPLRVIQDIEPLSVGKYRTTNTVEMMIYDFGAVSVTYNIALKGPLSDLLGLSDELYDNAALLQDARYRVNQLTDMIKLAVTGFKISEIVEDYAIYQVQEIAPRVEWSRLLAENSHQLAQILRAELHHLSDQEVEEALDCRISYGSDDVVIMDWNAAILFDTDADDVRAILEYTNVELLELRYLDGQLDDALEESYRTLTQRTWERRLLLKSQTNDLRRIAELQVNGALLFEGVNNALKLIGDQYLARVYRSASRRMHLNNWEANVFRKLQTLESMYDKIADHGAQRRMELLEWIIIILIAVSIAISLIPGLYSH